MQAKREVLLDQVFLIHRQLNELTHPGRLPAEILSEIFRNISPYDPAVKTSDGVRNAAQVCHHWRDVALCNSTLWTHIEMDRSENYIKMMLRRSRDCLIDVSSTRDSASGPNSDSDSDSGSSSDDEDWFFNGNCVYPLLWPEIRRIRSLVLPESPSFRHIPSSKLDAPHLQTYFENYSPSAYHEQHPLLPLLDAPRLRHAKIMTPSISALEFLPELAYLELHWEDGLATHSFERMMNALGCLPRLSTLRIAVQFHLWRTNPSIPDGFPSVSFHHLQSLEMIPPCDIVGAGLFLERAILPLSPRITIETEDDIGSHHARVQDLAIDGVRSILRRWSPGSANSNLHLQLMDRLDAGGVDDIKLSFSVSAQGAKPVERWATTAEPEEEFLLQTLFPCFREIDVYELLPPLCANLRLLSISAHQRSIRVHAFRQMLGSLKSVEVITVVNHTLTCYSCCRRYRRSDTHQLQFVGNDLYRVFAPTNNTPFLPHLSTVQFTRTELTGNLGCQVCLQEGRVESQVCDACRCTLHYPRLVSWLTHRRSLGLPLARLVLRDCSRLDELQRMELRFLIEKELVEIFANVILSYPRL